MKHICFLTFVSCFDWEITHAEQLQLPNGHRELRGLMRRITAPEFTEYGDHCPICE